MPSGWKDIIHELAHLPIMPSDLKDINKWCSPENVLESGDIHQLVASSTNLMDSSNTPHSAAPELPESGWALEDFSSFKGKEVHHKPWLQTRTIGFSPTGSDGISDNHGLSHLSLPHLPCVIPKRYPKMGRINSLKSAQTRPTGAIKTNLLHGLQQISPIHKCGLSTRQIHIFSERQRRRDMGQLFSTLKSLLPDLKLKTDRCTVLTEVIRYIRSLQENLEHLARKKTKILNSLVSSTKPEYYGNVSSHMKRAHNHSELPESLNLLSTDGGCKETPMEANVCARLWGDDTFITLSSPKKKGIWSELLLMLQKHKLEVVNATLTTSSENFFHCFHAKVEDVMKFDIQALQKALEDQIIVALSNSQWDYDTHGGSKSCPCGFLTL